MSLSMPKRVYTLNIWWSLAAIALVGLPSFTSSARAQSAPVASPYATGSTEQVHIIPETPLEGTLAAPSLEALLQEGSMLESQKRWSEALTHYEQALRNHPGEHTLVRRQDIAKLHYSLDRRYNDRSYRQSVRSLTTQQSLSLYLELLRKIQTHYVDTPPWQRLGVAGDYFARYCLDK